MRREFSWSFVDQICASAATFALTVLAAREFGPAGVGLIAVPYGAYLVLLGLQRALIIDPYLTRADAHLTSDDRALSAALFLSGSGAGLATMAFFAISRLWGGTPASDGFGAFTVWLIPAVLQVLLRSAAFRNGKGWIAATGSGIWLAVFAAAVAIGMRGDIGKLVASWGLGASVSAIGMYLFGFRSLQWVGPREAVRWWHNEAMRFGSWLVSGTVAWSILAYALLVGLAGILGTASVGAYRAVESVFSPLSLLGPALANPGFRAMREARDHGPRKTLQVAVRLSVFAGACTLLYALIAGFAHNVVFALYGTSFRKFASLIPPIALGQTLLATTIGPLILLKAARRGRDVALVGVGAALGALAVGLPLAALFGLTAAAWGIATTLLLPVAWAIRSAIAANREFNSQCEVRDYREESASCAS